MILDRNKNKNGHGKYALVSLRALEQAPEYQTLLDDLKAAGLLTYGNESPKDQFFVMKYGDVFTPGGLRGYAEAVRAGIKQYQDNVNALDGVDTEEAGEVRTRSLARIVELTEWAEQVESEMMVAAATEHKLPS